MSVSPVITCPECLKKFKGRGDLVGKKIKCPFCTKPFVVTAEAPAPKSAKAPVSTKEAATAVKAAAPPSPPTAPAPPPPAPKPPVDEDDEPIGGSYGVGNVDLTYRCPNCAQPMLNEEATICVYCGYNTLTREVGRTEKTFAVTGSEHLLYLTPGIVAAVFIVILIFFLTFYSVVLPEWLEESRGEFLSHESIRFWLSAICLGIIWSLGNICFKYFVLQPKPKEKKKED
jgi:DNA-directed RNA polymerase subunit RPC12/RpoP